ncbi:uncharacterized protein PG998_014937 [Apiospora kogelbergensis]|uniref:uncharacterized protein n=1 Tax=Apiospora kogelbergensis TaxID=1337665 RepID=UPI00312DAF7A
MTGAKHTSAAAVLNGDTRRRYSLLARIATSFALITLLCLAFLLQKNTCGVHVDALPQTQSIEDGVQAVLSGAPLIDGHNDFGIWIRAFYHNHIYAENFTGNGQLYGQVDFPRLKQGQLRGQFWSVYTECPKKQNDFNDSTYHETIHDTLQQIDLVSRLTNEYPANMKAVSTASELWSDFGSRKPQISGFLGVEGLHQIGNSASVLRTYYSLGVRYASLTHTCHNAFADSSEAEDGRPAHGGLSVAGVRIVAEMNRLGMLVDLSHSSFDAQRHALRVSRAPVVFSHSGAFGVCAHVRNVPDDVLQRLAANGGVVMISFYPSHVRCGDPQNAALADVADHIQYVGALIGYRHVGIGSDFDGMAAGPRGLEDVSKYPQLITELLKRGVSRKDMEGVVGGNILRVLEEVENVAHHLSDEKPLEDDVKDMFE